MIIDKIITWYAEKWAKDNLTTENLKKGFEAFCEWASDPNIREAWGRLAKFCVSEIIKEVKNKANENNEH